MGKIIKAAEGKTFIRISDDLIMGDTLDLGDNDSESNYFQIMKPEEETQEGDENKEAENKKQTHGINRHKATMNNNRNNR